MEGEKTPAEAAAEAPPPTETAAVRSNLPAEAETTAATPTATVAKQKVHSGDESEEEGEISEDPVKEEKEESNAESTSISTASVQQRPPDEEETVAMDISPTKKPEAAEAALVEPPANAALENQEEQKSESEEPVKEEAVPEAVSALPEQKKEQEPEEGGVAEEQPPQETTTYSTRGRSEPSETTPAPSVVHSPPPDELAPPTTTVAPPSFLSDSLTEEERRTRTRYIPVVSGMHQLRKHEIKGDLSLARTGKHRRNKRQESESGEEDGTKSPAHSEDERMLLPGGKSIALGTTHLILPCGNVFAPPDTNTTKPSPRHVEAVTAFNPPRPPESIGAKKKHRLLRWERRPADMEVDLTNYRKTVQRTQDELRSAQRELARLVERENVQRTHWLQHQHNLQAQIKRLNAVLQREQAKCPWMARTRSRGAAVWMREMLSALQQEEAAAVVTSSSSSDKKDGAAATSSRPLQGLGGVGCTSFQDWNHNTPFVSQEMATGWIVPGDKVVVVRTITTTTTRDDGQKEEGTVVAVPVYDDDHDKEEEQVDENAMDVDSPASNNKKKPKGKLHRGAPKVAVQLTSSGVTANFSPADLQIKEDPRTYSDERLAQRWTALYETAKAVAPVLDLEGMAIQDDDDDDNGGGSDHSNQQDKRASRRLLPFGAELLPTKNGRGQVLLQEQETKVETWDQALEKPLYTGGGVCGFRGNRSVPQQLSALEELREEKILLQARALQLRNKVYRQRRIRLLNERTLSATQDRAVRVEGLVAEMRADLKSLKTRLDDEIRELGVSEEQAERILADYFRSLGDDEEETSPAEDESTAEPNPKRPRHAEESEEEGEIQEEPGQVVETTTAVEAKP